MVYRSLWEFQDVIDLVELRVWPKVQDRTRRHELFSATDIDINII